MGKGPRCNQDINECGSGSYYSFSYVAPTHSCSRYGTCINTAGSYRCQCRDGWEGEYCSEMRNCESHPCYNNGTCISLVYPPYTQCRCPTGFTGSQCEVEDFCARRPCINGICTNTGQGFSCSCFSGYTGQTCEDREDLCITENCNMRGTCREVSNGREWRTACTCNHGYDGVRCQLDIVRELNRELQRKDVELQRKENELREERRKLWDEKIKVREFENDKSKCWPSLTIWQEKWRIYLGTWLVMWDRLTMTRDLDFQIVTADSSHWICEACVVRTVILVDMICSVTECYYFVTQNVPNP